MLKYKIMFQIFFVPKYFWVLEAVIFGTLLPDHPVEMSISPHKIHISLILKENTIKILKHLPSKKETKRSIFNANKARHCFPAVDLKWSPLKTKFLTHLCIY